MLDPRPLLATLALAALSTVAAEPLAFAGGAVQQPHVTAELVSEHLSLQPGRDAWFVVRLRIEDGWHVYWKNPGDSGLAPELAWELPEGFTADAPRWPLPERIEQDPIVNFGYERELLLPVRIRVPKSLTAKHARLAVDASWLVCKDVCLTGEGRLELDLPAVPTEPRVDPEREALFARVRAALPVPWKEGAATATHEGERVVLRMKDLPATEHVEFFPADETAVTLARAVRIPAVTLGLVVGLTASKTRGQRLRGVLAVGEGARRKGYEIDVPLR